MTDLLVDWNSSQSSGGSDLPASDDSDEVRPAHASEPVESKASAHASSHSIRLRPGRLHCRRRSSRADGSRRSHSRSVRFNQDIRCLVIPGVWQMSQHEIDSAWYGPNDSHYLKKDVKRNIRRMRSENNSNNNNNNFCDDLNSEKYCYRGLEHLRSSATLQQRTEEQALVIGAILKSQDSPNRTPQTIADVAERVTRPAKNRAIQAAMQDETDAKAIMRALSSSSMLSLRQPEPRNVMTASTFC